MEDMTLGHPRYTREVIAARGQAIYEHQLRGKLGPQHDGEYLVINIETGEYLMDEDEVAVSKRAYAQYPDAPLYGMRIGCEAWGRIGWCGAATPR
jgi:hypothetical protein